MLLENLLPSMNYGTNKIGLMKSKEVKLLYKLLWSLDMKNMPNYG